MDDIFRNIYINRAAIQKLAKITGNICTAGIIASVSAIFTMINIYYIAEKQDELERRIECLELGGDNTSKKGE